MKNTILFLLIFMPVLILGQTAAETEIDTFIDQWHQDAANVDRKAYFDKIDDKGIFIGTDATEIWTKQEFFDWAKPQFTGDGTAWDFKAIDRNIYSEKQSDYVWFDELLSFSGGVLRGSGVLVKREGDWKILHYVLSLPVPNEKFRAVMEVMKEE